MTDELKSQIAALRTAIMRRVEYDGSIHASSLEDEIGKWIREVLEPKWKKWADEPDRMVRAAAYRSALELCDAQAEQDKQRRAQALAQQKFTQPIADSYGDLSGLNQTLRGHPATMVVRETDMMGKTIETVTRNGKTYKREVK